MCVWRERTYCEILVVCGEWERGREVRRLAKMFVNVCVCGERERGCNFLRWRSLLHGVWAYEMCVCVERKNVFKKSWLCVESGREGER